MCDEAHTQPSDSRYERNDTTFDLERGTADLDELLAHRGLEAVQIAGPVATHAEAAIAAARRGLHVPRR